MRNAERQFVSLCFLKKYPVAVHPEFHIPDLRSLV